MLPIIVYSSKLYLLTKFYHFFLQSGKELIFFSSADLKRSIPSMVDGLKRDQRKVLCCAFERKLHEEIIVSDFINYMSWHKGQKNLGCAIIEMAQDFVGSNNINLLIPNGQFGTRDFVS